MEEMRIFVEDGKILSKNLTNCSNTKINLTLYTLKNTYHLLAKNNR